MINIQPSKPPAVRAPEEFIVEDSAFGRRLQLRVGRARIDNLAQAERVTEQCARQGYGLGIATCQASDFRLVTSLGMRGWYITDLEIVFAGPAQPSPAHAPFHRRTAKPADAGVVAELSHHAFASHLSHYATDFRMNPGLPSLAYSEWASRMCSEPDDSVVVLLYENDEELVYFSACRIINAADGELLLAGMHPRYRGKRLGTVFTADSIGYLHGRGLANVTAVTGAANVPSQLQLIRCGLRPREAFYVLHRWFHADAGLAGSNGRAPHGECWTPR